MLAHSNSNYVAAIEPKARIVNIGYASGSYRAGDIVQVSVEIANNESIPWNFTVGFSVQDPDGGWWDAPGKIVLLFSGEISPLLLLNWTVPQDAPVGPYNVRIAIWKQQLGLLLHGQLDETTQYRVFTVLGPLKIIYAIPQLISLVPAFIFSLVRDRKTVRKSAVVLYGFSSLAYGASLSFSPFSPDMFQFLATIFVVWGLASLTFRLLYRSKYSYAFSYRYPSSLAIGIVVYTYLVARLDILLAVSASLLLLAHWIPNMVNRKTIGYHDGKKVCAGR